MARLNDFSVGGKMEAPKLDPRIVIVRPGFNYRDTTSEAAEAHIQWLMQSIKEVGVQQPIRVEFDDGKVYLVDGECRLRACQRLWKEGVRVPYKDGGHGPPVVPAVATTGDEANILASSMLANGSLPPTKLEFGAAADRLLKHGWSIESIALYIPPHIGVKGAKAKRFVSEAVSLHQAPLAVKDAVKNGVDGVKLSESAALSIAKNNRSNASEKIQEAVSDAKSKGESVAKRPKAEGAVTKQRNGLLEFNNKLLELADVLAEAILNDDIPIGEVQKKARAYQKLRKAD